MKTEIFADYSAFLSRSDISINGVTQLHADANPGWDKERKNVGCWNSSGCSDCSDCSRCSRCSDCSYCSYCSDCSRLRNKNGERPVEGEPVKSWLDIPVIQDIHGAVAKAVEAPDSLNMQTWHTCETTHCRAGWVVHLAGERGRALETATSTLFAAMQIYKASSPVKVSPVRFFEKNEVALADIKRCAGEEAKLAEATI